MNILFVYKDMYHVRETTELEYLFTISKQYNYKLKFFYDSDVFGPTDNVLYCPSLIKKFMKRIKLEIKK